VVTAAGEEGVPVAQQDIEDAVAPQVVEQPEHRLTECPFQLGLLELWLQQHVPGG
jgi:hypothetical protein